MNNTAVFQRIVNRRLKLGIDEQRLAAMKHGEFMASPEVEAYRASVTPERFAYVFGWIGMDPDLLAVLTEIPGACAGAWKLAEIADLCYYTARLVPAVPSLSDKIADATRRWLRSVGFPNPDHVAFCDGTDGKLHHIDELTRQTDEPIILIDDLAETLRVQASDAQLALKTVTIYAFGAPALRSWSHIDELVTELEQAHGRQRQKA